MKIKWPIRPPSSEVPFSMGVPALLWQILFFYLPLLLIAATSFMHFTKTGQLSHLTSEPLLFFLRAVYAKVIGSSLLLALANALICLLIGYPIAYFLAIRCKRFQSLFLFLLIVPFWTNFLLHVYAWFYVLEKDGFLNQLLTSLHLISEPLHLLNSLPAILLMMVYYYLPFMVLPLFAALERFDLRMMEASLDLGATRLQTFRKVVLPLTFNGIVAGFFLVFIPSFGEFAIPELMGGDKIMFVGSVVSHYILGERTGSYGSAFTLVSSLVLLLSCFLLYFLLKRLIKPKETHA